MTAAELRAECWRDIEELRTGGELPERAFRLLEKLVSRLDRIEVGYFPPDERPTRPETSPGFKAVTVEKILQEGKK